jgi:hypothetical protein
MLPRLKSKRWQSKIALAKPKFTTLSAGENGPKDEKLKNNKRSFASFEFSKIRDWALCGLLLVHMVLIA